MINTNKYDAFCTKGSEGEKKCFLVLIKSQRKLGAEFNDIYHVNFFFLPSGPFMWNVSQIHNLKK